MPSIDFNAHWIPAYSNIYFLIKVIDTHTLGHKLFKSWNNTLYTPRVSANCRVQWASILKVICEADMPNISLWNVRISFFMLFLNLRLSFALQVQNKQCEDVILGSGEPGCISNYYNKNKHSFGICRSSLRLCCRLESTAPVFIFGNVPLKITSFFFFLFFFFFFPHHISQCSAFSARRQLLNSPVYNTATSWSTMPSKPTHTCVSWYLTWFITPPWSEAHDPIHCCFLHHRMFIGRKKGYNWCGCFVFTYNRSVSVCLCVRIVPFCHLGAEHMKDPTLTPSMKSFLS